VVSMRKQTIGCLGSLLLAAVIAGFLAIILFGAVGGVAIGVWPKATFGLVAPLLCPATTSLDYHEVIRSYHQPGESEPHLDCVQPNGTREDVLGKGIVIVLGGAWLILFGATFLPLTFLFLLTSIGIGTLLGKQKDSSQGIDTL
jgi:hypothetical protein